MFKKKVKEDAGIEPQNLELSGKEKETEVSSNHRRIVDLLDIQLLLAVIVFFVSAWAFLNGVICDFTTTEPHNERMSYILVHYLLSLMLILCIGITYIKGKYLLKTEKENFLDEERRYIDLFIDGWLPVLILSLIIITINSILPWWTGLLVFCISLYYYMFKHKFGLWESSAITLTVFLLFPVFISIMTNISRNVEIGVSYNKEIESLSIEVDAKGYDCRYFVDGLADVELRKGHDYEISGPVIRMYKAYLRNNMVTVKMISPASGSEFLKYAIRKIRNREDIMVLPQNASYYNKTKIISIEN